MRMLFCRMPGYFGVENSHPENSMMSLEIAYMISIAKKNGFQVEVMDLEAEPLSIIEFKNQIHSGNFDYIVLRAKSPSLEIIKEVFSNIKSKIIGIGHIFSTRPEEMYALDNFSLFCTLYGEPENAFQKLLSKLVSTSKDLNEIFKNTPGIIYQDTDGEIVKNPQEIVENLDELPSPDFSLFNQSKYYTFYPVPFGTKKKFGFLMISRGCPYDCSFCSPTLRNSTGKKMRFHSHERVISDMRSLEKAGRTIIFFRDDIFTINKNYTMELCKKIIASGLKIKWCAQTHINNIDEELLLLMHKAGCVSLGFGLESGSKKILNVVQKTNKIENAPRLVKYAQKKGIKIVCFFLVGCPSENKEDQNLSLKLLKETMPNLIQVAFFTPYPGSQDYERYIENKEAYQSSLHHYNNYQINYTELSTQEVEKFQKQMYKTWFFHPKTLMNTTLGLVSDLIFNYSYFQMFLDKGCRFLLNLLKKGSVEKKEISSQQA